MGRTKFAFIGGDLRQIRVANLFYGEGHEVSVFGFDDPAGSGLNSGIKIAASLDDALPPADAVILPLPYTSGKGMVNVPLGKAQTPVSDVFRKMLPGQIMFLGMADEKANALAQLFNIHIVDYFAREELSVRNAVPTAEGAIAIAINETPFTLHGSNCLILGFGRVGKALASPLSAMGAKVSVAARKQADLAWADNLGYKPVPFENLPAAAEAADIIFNTVPHTVLDARILRALPANCLVIDLASKPGGVDFILGQETGRLSLDFVL